MNYRYWYSITLYKPLLEDLQKLLEENSSGVRGLLSYYFTYCLLHI